MLTIGVPILFTLLVWWLSTGVVLYVIGRPRRTFPASMLVTSLLTAVALYGLAATADDTTVHGAYVAFLAALTVWGWHEMSFLTGYVTGPRTSPLPEGATGSVRLLAAIETVIYHELALFVTLVILALMLWGSPNETGLWTFAVLWIMRLSAKLNVYLGVLNLTEEFLPDHLKYLRTYFRHRPMNLLFPVSVTAASVLLAIVVSAGMADDAGPFEMCEMTLVATMLALGILEHWFLVLPIGADALWTWGLASRSAGEDMDDPDIAPATSRDGPHSSPVAL